MDNLISFLVGLNLGASTIYLIIIIQLRRAKRNKKTQERDFIIKGV
jgi:hypothetical protein